MDGYRRRADGQPTCRRYLRRCAACCKGRTSAGVGPGAIARRLLALGTAVLRRGGVPLILDPPGSRFLALRRAACTTRIKTSAEATTSTRAEMDAAARCSRAAPVAEDRRRKPKSSALGRRRPAPKLSPTLTASIPMRRWRYGGLKARTRLRLLQAAGDRERAGRRPAASTHGRIGFPHCCHRAIAAPVGPSRARPVLVIAPVDCTTRPIWRSAAAWRRSWSSGVVARIVLRR